VWQILLKRKNQAWKFWFIQQTLKCENKYGLATFLFCNKSYSTWMSPQLCDIVNLSKKFPKISKLGWFCEDLPFSYFAPNPYISQVLFQLCDIKIWWIFFNNLAKLVEFTLGKKIQLFCQKTTKFIKKIMIIIIFTMGNKVPNLMYFNLLIYVSF
jgi:hypothetical protein